MFPIGIDSFLHNVETGVCAMDLSSAVPSTAIAYKMLLVVPTFPHRQHPFHHYSSFFHIHCRVHYSYPYSSLPPHIASLLKKSMGCFLHHPFRHGYWFPSWIVRLCRCHIDLVGVVEIRIKQPEGQLGAPSVLPALSCQIKLGLPAIPLVDEMEGIRVINVLL